MGTKRELLIKRIRETISNLSDDRLAEMALSSRQYTAFARSVLEEELIKRKGEKGGEQKVPRKTEAYLATLRESPGEHRSGCYLDVWSRENFEGELFRIEGPAEYQDLVTATLDWHDLISSIRVGPNAFVLLYDEEEFKGRMISLGPNQEVLDLKELGFNNAIDSIRLISSLKIFDQSRSENSARENGALKTSRNKPRVKNRVRRRSKEAK